MGNTFIISGLKEKRSTVAGRMIDLRREIDRLQADLYHIDAVLKLYGLEPDEIPAKGRMPKRSAYFARGEISRRCHELMRERGLISADDVAVSAMVDKGLDPDANRKQRADFTRRILVSLHDLRKAEKVDQLGTKTRLNGNWPLRPRSEARISPRIAETWWRFGERALFEEQKSNCNIPFHCNFLLRITLARCKRAT